MKHIRGASGLLLVLALLLGMVPAQAYSVTVEDGDVSVTPGLDEAWMNILLIGTDTRADSKDAGRSDSMMICSICSQTSEVKITSLARDTWVEIAQIHTMNKLNAAHSFGGPNLLMKTINETYEMNIEKYVAVNFYGLASVIDQMGGVYIALEEGEANAINQRTKEKYGQVSITPLKSGQIQAVLCGAQAIGYAGIRSLDNDFGRTNRQRKLLQAMLDQFMTLSVGEQIAVVQTALESVKTNLTLGEILSLAQTAMQREDQTFATYVIPQQGDYRYATSAQGASCLEIDREACIQKLHAFIYDQDAQEEETIAK